MSVIDDIVKAFGSQVAMADATGISQQTISEWVNRDPPEIPPWRRPEIVSCALRNGVALDDHAQEYLRSKKRTPRRPKPVAAEQQVAA